MRFSSIHLCRVLLNSRHSISMSLGSVLWLDYSNTLTIFFLCYSGVIGIIVLLHGPMSARLSPLDRWPHIWLSNTLVSRDVCVQLSDVLCYTVVLCILAAQLKFSLICSKYIVLEFSLMQFANLRCASMFFLREDAFSRHSLAIPSC